MKSAMLDQPNPEVCPVEKAGGLDNAVRRFLQNPNRILRPYIKPGMTVLDVGCGPGVFTTEIAKLLAGSGKVIAADLQDGMLARVQEKIAGTDLEQRIQLHKCEEDSIGVTKKVDFILAFYMVHEVPNQEKFFKELKSILKSNGTFLVVEPKFHVSRKAFEAMLQKLDALGFKTARGPKVFFSRTALVTHKSA